MKVGDLVRDTITEQNGLIIKAEISDSPHRSTVTFFHVIFPNGVLHLCRQKNLELICESR